MHERRRVLTRTIDWAPEDGPDPLLAREWLVTNGLGGYAAGTLCGVPTRRYHSLLVAALPAPHGRMVMLNHLGERLRLPDRTVVWLSGEERVGSRLDLPGLRTLRDFTLEHGLPLWRYEPGDCVLEKRLRMVHGQNTVHVAYTLVSAPGPVRLGLRPSLHFRPHDSPVNQGLPEPCTVTAEEDRYEIRMGHQAPPLRLRIVARGGAFTLEQMLVEQLLYRIEESRGYDSKGDLWSPGYFRADLSPGETATLVASTEPWEVLLALSPGAAGHAEIERRRRLIAQAPPPARDGLGAELVLAADQFIITPAGRIEDAARARAAGDAVRTVIAGYHWFTDWGRDTMISLEGLTLATGRHHEAGYILRTFAHYIRDGLLPNLFPEGDREGLYHTADATLWYFQALHRYIEATDDRATLRLLLPRLVDIVRHHVQGTRFGLGVDADDGLLRQGAEGYQLTWMDAKMEDWVVTPRRGKAVEINGLWYNALRLLASWLRQEDREAEADDLDRRAELARESFNRRFRYERGGYLYDVVDGEQGDDASCRPNQLLAFSLAHPVLDRDRWEPVLDVVQERLVTPVGLRSLAPGSPDYKPTYHGDLRTRDAAYHQGTVWAWLVGPYVDAWLRVRPHERDQARQYLEGFDTHLSQACIGSISEIFDAEAPFTPRGCVAQAWSVAEVLRCWLRAITGASPSPETEDAGATHA